MPAQRQADMAIVLDHFAAGRHRPERDDGFVDLGHGFGLARHGGGAQGEWLVPQSLDLP
jgi:hypothetical protein